MLLFRECDWRGRKLLFDSSSVEKVPLDPKAPLQKPQQSDLNDMIVEVSKGYGYKVGRLTTSNLSTIKAPVHKDIKWHQLVMATNEFLSLLFLCDGVVAAQ